MKLDEKYFKGKVDLVCGKFKGLHVVNTRILGNVLKQIALDGAEAQKVADDTAVKNYMDRGILLGTLNINGVRAAIESAAVKWEVKGE